MFSNLDPLFLARVQFAFTVSYHIIFPAFTIGLASWLAVVECSKPATRSTNRSTCEIFFIFFMQHCVYNRLVRLRNMFREGWSGIEGSTQAPRQPDPKLFGHNGGSSDGNKSQSMICCITNVAM